MQDQRLLPDLISDLLEARTGLDALEEQVKKSKAFIASTTREIVEHMNSQGMDSIAMLGHTITPSAKLHASVPQYKMDEFVAALQERGYGSMAKMTVNPQTLRAWTADNLEANAAFWPEWPAPFVTTNTDTTLSVRHR
jgi:hypothetical protein